MDYTTCDAFEIILIRAIMTDPSIFVRLKPILDDSYFTDTPLHSNARVIRVLKDLSEKDPSYVLNLDALNEYLSGKNPHEDEIKKIENWDVVKDSENIIQQAEHFCRYKACKNAAMTAYRNIEEGHPDGIVKMMEDAVNIRLNSDNVIDIFDANIDELLESHTHDLNTPWPNFNQCLSGGFGYGELEVCTAVSGGGKSIMLCNLATHYINQGLNVLYVTLELSKTEIKKRIIAMIGQFKINSLRDNQEEIKTFVSSKTKNQLCHILYLQNNTTVEELLNNIKFLENKHQKTYQIILVDYADLLYPSARINIDNTHLKEGMVYQELRDFAAKRTEANVKTTIFTASQLSKEAMKSEDKNQSQIAGSISKVQICDNMFNIQKGSCDFSRKISFLKTRNSNGMDKNIELDYNSETLTLSAPEDASSILEQAISSTNNTTFDINSVQCSC